MVLTGESTRRSLLVLLVLLLVLLVLGGCSAVQTPSELPRRDRLTGAPLWTDDRGEPHVEVVLLHASILNAAPGDVSHRPFTVVRDGTTLARLVVPSQPIDFRRWLVVVPGTGVPSGSAAEVRRVTAQGELASWRSSEQSFELRYTQPCATCGGASSTALEARRCLATLPPRIFLVPRARAVTIGVVDRRCSMDLP